MKKVLKKKSWIAAAVIAAVVLAALYLPIRSGYDQTLNAQVFRCDENGKIIETEPLEEITVKIDVNRHKFLLSDRQTISGDVEFSAYFKTGKEGETSRTENVGFVLEMRYAKALAENQSQAVVPVEGADQDRALENKSETKEYLTCSNIYYEDNEGYTTAIAYEDPDDIPIQREMKYSENFDKMIWTDYQNGFLYVCATDKIDMDMLQAYFEMKLR